MTVPTPVLLLFSLQFSETLLFIAWSQILKVVYVIFSYKYLKKTCILQEVKTKWLQVSFHLRQQYEKRNPALIICSEELKLVLKCTALHYKELKIAIISHLAFTHEYLGKVWDPKTHSPNSQCFATHIWTNKKAQFKLKNPFLGLIQNMTRINQNRTVFIYEEICALVCKYIRDRRDQFFHEQNIKI